MSLKEKFETISGTELEKIITKYFFDFYSRENFNHYAYLFPNYLNNIDSVFDNAEISWSKPNIYLHTIYKLIDKLDKAKIDCSKFDDSHFFNIIRLSKVAYDFAINTSNNYNVLIDYQYPCNKDNSLVSFEEYKNAVDEVIKDVDVYHDKIVEWYKKNKKLPSTPIGFGYGARKILL